MDLRFRLCLTTMELQKADMKSSYKIIAYHPPDELLCHFDSYGHFNEIGLSGTILPGSQGELQEDTLFLEAGGRRKSFRVPATGQVRHPGQQSEGQKKKILLNLRCAHIREHMLAVRKVRDKKFR